jgi:hypothetical protein
VSLGVPERFRTSLYDLTTFNKVAVAEKWGPVERGRWSGAAASLKASGVEDIYLIPDEAVDDIGKVRSVSSDPAHENVPVNRAERQGILLAVEELARRFRTPRES